MNCKICGSDDFDKEGRVWTCNVCKSEHVLTKSMTHFQAVYLPKTMKNINIKLTNVYKTYGFVIGDNNKVTQVFE